MIDSEELFCLSLGSASTEPKPFIDVSIITRFNQHSNVMQFKWVTTSLNQLKVSLNQFKPSKKVKVSVTSHELSWSLLCQGIIFNSPACLKEFYSLSSIRYFCPETCQSCPRHPRDTEERFNKMIPEFRTFRTSELSNLVIPGQVFFQVFRSSSNCLLNAG